MAVVSRVFSMGKWGGGEAAPVGGTWPFLLHGHLRILPRFLMV